MKKINRLLLLTIVSNFFILIGAGHGLGFLGLIEVMVVKELCKGTTEFSVAGNYENRLFLSAIIAMLGQIILTIAFSLKNGILKYKATYGGLSILLISFILLTMDITDSNLDILSFLGGTPFLIFAVMLLVATIKSHRIKT